MGSKIKWTGQSHVDALTLASIERGEVDQSSHPALFRHLREACDTCDDFLSPQSLRDTDDYDINTKEVARILQVILDEIEDDRQRMAAAAKASTAAGKASTAVPKPRWQEWQQWVWGWFAAIWAVPAALGLLFIALPSQEAIAPSGQSVAGNGCKGCQEGGTGAFLHISVDRRHAAKESHSAPTRPLQSFTQGGTYHIGDAMLFRFQIINDGYIALYRQDHRGQLERLYPFPKQGAVRVQSGKDIQLRHKGKPLAYYLEASHQGQQSFHLVHSPKPIQFPTNLARLTQAQKKLLAQADYVRFQVQAPAHRLK